VAHFKEETRKAKVEVELQNHPLMDPIQVKLDKLKVRKKGDPHRSWWARRIIKVRGRDVRLHRGEYRAPQRLDMICGYYILRE